MKRLIPLFALILFTISASAATFANGGPRTTNNDDTCDVAALPAATLLLPLFEVDVDTPPTGPTTLFTITNVTNVDRVARVTLWTEFAYPVLTFNLYLTGYDVQAINLFDIIARGIVAPDSGTGTAVTKRGSFSDPNTAIDLSKCNRLPGGLDATYVDLMQNAFTEGRVQALGNVVPACNTVGRTHALATGYATIDVVGNCEVAGPIDDEYFRRDIRYDNVLIGDYQQVDSANNYAQANPLVHIRAMPEGGTPASRQSGAENQVNFDRTFYDRYSPATFNDGRQPLPSTFGARFIQGGPLEFATLYKIWRENPTGPNANCAAYGANANQRHVEVVRFDENENFVVGPVNENGRFTGASITDVSDSIFPQLTNGALSGWTYLNLDATSDDDEATQNWVIVSMRSQGQYSVDFEATALGNGCSPERGRSEATQTGGTTIGPAANTTP